MNDPHQITTASETKRALASLASCPGWTDWLRPKIEAGAKAIEEEIMLNDELTAEQREQKRVAWKHVKAILEIEIIQGKWADSVLREKPKASQ